MVFIPKLSAQPNSRSILLGSNESACHISSSLIALAGLKLLPTSQGCFSYQSFACCSVHFTEGAATAVIERKTIPTINCAVFRISDMNPDLRLLCQLVEPF